MISTLRYGNTPQTFPWRGNVTSTKYSEEFLKIWKEYPRTDGKFAAFRAFERLKCQNGDVEMIIESIRAHCELPAWRHSLAREDGKHVPHLATFLNQRRFEDEI